MYGFASPFLYDGTVVAVWDQRLHAGALVEGLAVAPASLSG